jgi:hypothetical protein
MGAHGVALRYLALGYQTLADFAISRGHCIELDEAMQPWSITEKRPILEKQMQYQPAR